MKVLQAAGMIALLLVFEAAGVFLLVLALSGQAGEGAAIAFGLGVVSILGPIALVIGVIVEARKPQP